MDLLSLALFHWPHYDKQPMRFAGQVASIGTRKQNAGCNIERRGSCCNPRVSFPGGLSPKGTMAIILNFVVRLTSEVAGAGLLLI
jgi:hypothetical protein